MSEVDIVIPTFGRQNRVDATLLMLLKQTILPANVIIVNQTPGVDSESTEVSQLYKAAGVELIWINRASPSLCGARNDALRRARSRICLCLDDDILIPSDLVAQHAQLFRQRPELAAIGGQVWHRKSDFKIRDLSIENPTLGTVIACNLNIEVSHGPLFGGHFSIRRDIALSIGGWDESFIGSANWEEGDLMNRLKAHGYNFIWNPKAWLIHLREPMGGCRIPGNKTFPEWTKTTNFFLYKYRYPTEKSWPVVLNAALRAGPLRREVVCNPAKWPEAWFGFFMGWLEGRKRYRYFLLLKNE